MVVKSQGKNRGFLPSLMYLTINMSHTYILHSLG